VVPHDCISGWYTFVCRTLNCSVTENDNHCICLFALESSEDNVGFTDDNQKWLRPAKKTKLDLSESDSNDDDVVSTVLFSL